MKKIKNIFPLIAFTLLSIQAFAIETGGILSNDTKFDGNKIKKLKLNQKDSASIWLSEILDDEGTTSIFAKGTYEFNYDKNYEGRDRFINTLDIDILNFRLNREISNANFILSAGRFYNQDLTGKIFSQTADGILISYTAPQMEVSLYGAYTGLLNSHVITMIDEEADEKKSRWLYELSSQYAVCSATVSFPYLFLNQTLSLQGLGTFKLEKKRYLRHYGTIQLTGPIIPDLYYEISSTVGARSYDDESFKVTNLSKASLMFFPQFKSTYLAANVIYASGRQKGLRSFKGFTSMTAVNSLEEKEYTELLKPGIELSMKPLESLFISASGDLIYSAEKAKLKHEGFQYNADCNWQIFSDLTIGAGISQYFDKKESDYNKTTVQLRATFTF